MKKLFAIVIALFFVSATLAQHSNVVNQFGPENTSTVTQYFDGSGTNFDGNTAFVDQIGMVNTSSVLQANNGYGGGGEWADVHQEGNYNTSTVQQFNFGHDAWVYQLGHVNTASIYQNDNLTDAEVTQIGNSNFGSIFEYGEGVTFAWIRQYGLENFATQTLGQGQGFVVKNSSFTALQQGNVNRSVQYLEGEGFMGGALSVGNLGEVVQLGNYNDAEQLMYTGGFDAEGNVAKLWSQGNANISDQYMKRNDNTSIVTQVGNSNVSVSYQNW